MAEDMKQHPLGENQTYNNAGISLAAQPIAFAAQIFARKGQTEAVSKKLKLPTTPGQGDIGSRFNSLPLSPGQWLVVSHGNSGPGLDEIEGELADIGYASQQTESRVCIRVSGSKARELMSRGCRLDLHQDVVGKNFCAQTQMAQVGVLIHQISDGAEYDLYVYSGFARSFWHWLTETAEQFR